MSCFALGFYSDWPSIPGSIVYPGNQVSRGMTSSHGRTGGEWADRVATTVLDCYHALGRNGKPQPHEWTVLAAILSENTDGSGSAGAFEVLSLATGNKCVGMNSLCGRGEVVNGMIACKTTRINFTPLFGCSDSHAEVLTRRSFLR